MVQGRAYNVTNLPAKAQEISYHSTIFFSRTKQIFLPLSSLIFALVLSKCGDKVSVRVHDASVYGICRKQKMGLVGDRLLLVFAHGPITISTGSVEMGRKRCSKGPLVASQHQKPVEMPKALNYSLALVPEPESEASSCLSPLPRSA